MTRFWFFFLVFASMVVGGEPLRLLIVDGRNNHDWEATTDSLRATLEATGRFEVEVSTAPEMRFPRVPHRAQREEDQERLAEVRGLFAEAEKEAKAELAARWAEWKPDFAGADVVLLNYNGPDWSLEVKDAYLEYVRSGGGTVLVHAANNAFANWLEFNDLIGLGWRPALVGKAPKIDPETGGVIFPANDVLVSEGKSGHGSKHPFQVTVRAADHPVMRGLPPVWLHASDELYHNMRGPAEGLTILSSAYSDPAQRGSGMHEPMTWEVAYGEGRAIVTSLGHLWPGDVSLDALQCVGFQTMISRACEYVATGDVTLPVHENFPTADEVSVLAPHKMMGVEVSQLQELAAKVENPYCMLSPEDELKTFEIAPGYVAELFASEPQVQEPVLTVWGGDGAMYVAEMRSYMQDVTGEGTKTMRNGRVKRLVDTDGDGRADEVTVFIDNLNLPRAILPLGDWIAVRESDTLDVYAYRDADGDGVAEEKKLLYERGTDGRQNPKTSVEHQDSGLMWNLDNNIYITYNSERYRYTTGEWIAEKQPSHWTQWGLTHDDVGDIFWSTNSDPLLSAYVHPRYWGTARRLSGKSLRGDPIKLPDPHSAEFEQAFSSCLLNDRGGAVAAVRGFTSACGQSIYRSNKFPHDARGDYFFCDPTIHVVRRAHVTKPGAMVHLEKAEPEGEEFLRSSDINSRFINTAEGPDGCLYVTDMYRGIIQDAGWLSPGPRENIVANGLDKNIQHGRIWRIRHQDHTPAKVGNLDAESTVSLLRHLGSASGWHRDMAQRLIILREDRESVTGLLEGLARFSSNPLERLHALWTLEGMDAVSVELLVAGARDRDALVRRAVVQIAEPMMADAAVFAGVAEGLAEDSDPEVAKQLILSLGMLMDHPASLEVIQKACRKHPQAKGVQLAGAISLWGMTDLPLAQEVESGTAFDPAVTAEWKNFFTNWSRGLSFPDEMPKEDRVMIENGEVHYFSSCVVCHGSDGMGAKVGGSEVMLAPPLKGSARVAGDPGQLIPVMLHGLMGPIEGQNYQAGYMAPAKTLGLDRDNHIAEVLSYIRYAWGQEGEVVTTEEVIEAKETHQERGEKPWSDEELKGL